MLTRSGWLRSRERLSMTRGTCCTCRTEGCVGPPPCAQTAQRHGGALVKPPACGWPGRGIEPRCGPSSHTVTSQTAVMWWPGMPHVCHDRVNTRALHRLLSCGGLACHTSAMTGSILGHFTDCCHGGGLACHTSAMTGSILGLVGRVLVFCDWVRQQV